MATENTKTKTYFYLKLKAKTISVSTDHFRKLPYLSGNLLPVLSYLNPSPTHAFPGPIARGGSVVGIGSLLPCNSTILNGMLVYV